MKKSTLLLIVFLLCTWAMACSNAKPVNTPTPTTLPTHLPTAAPKPTLTLTPFPVWVTLGSPFAPDCGDGIPRIWSNDSFNAPGMHEFDEHHGHVDIFVPFGCNVNNYEGEVLAPASGKINHWNDEIYDLVLPEGEYLEGLIEALEFSGDKAPDISLISEIRLNFGHVKLISGEVQKGQSIGDIVPCCNQQKLAYQIVFNYAGDDYMFTPTLFSTDGPEWLCVDNSPYDCQPEPHDYAP